MQEDRGNAQPLEPFPLCWRWSMRASQELDIRQDHVWRLASDEDKELIEKELHARRINTDKTNRLIDNPANLGAWRVAAENWRDRCEDLFIALCENT